MVWIKKKKNTFSTFCLSTKEYKGEEFYSTSPGCLYGSNGQLSPMVYFIAPNIHNDANFTLTIIQPMITHWSSNLPQVSISKSKIKICLDI